ncbi:uncharacterized protein LOC117807007 isoform X4 [Notolabrus celidotus]|uniref:uncharacterized protein LOC117807007 isoform X4 n=1 Tax=Notolabrus celidotus TaxID=1203425 RepID=UPI00148FB316|nr:uncharacterized protein LOC117807007 isoform X4 [Notolabrus celidotus]
MQPPNLSSPVLNLPSLLQETSQGFIWIRYQFQPSLSLKHSGEKMSGNISSSSSDSLLHSNFSLINKHSLVTCFVSKPSSFILTTYFITNVLLLLPLCILVLCLGLQWYRQHLRSNRFTFQIVIMELIGVFGSILICCGIHSVLAVMIQGRGRKAGPGRELTNQGRRRSTPA